MNKILLNLGALVCLASFTFQDIADAHGGTYRGPGGGGSGGTGDTAPPPTGSGSGGTQGSGGTPAGPGSGRSAGGGSSGTGGSSGNSGSSTPSMPTGPGTDTWEPWWAFNRDPFLNLKAVIHDSDLLLGSDIFFLGHAPVEMVRDFLRPSDEVIRGKVVPALLEVLETEKDKDLVTGALIALAKIGDDPAPNPDPTRIATRLATFFSSPNQEIAETAAVSLGILANDESVAVLDELLADTKTGRDLVGGREVPWRTRAFAAYGLGLIGYRSTNPTVRARVVSALVDTLEGDGPRMATPDVAVACLTAFGLVPLAIDDECRMLSEGSPLPYHCRRGQVQWLLEYSARPDINYMVRAHVPTSMARLVVDCDRDPELTQLVGRRLLSLAQGQGRVPRELRTSAILGLGQLGSGRGGDLDLEILTTLMKIAKDSRQPHARTLALVSLGQTAARKRINKNASVEELGKIRTFLLERLLEGRSTDRGWSALALSLLERAARDSGLAPSKDVALALRNVMLGAKSPREVGAYAIALGVMQDTESASILVQKLEDTSDDRARGHICIALGLMNAREAVEPLRAILSRARYRPLLLREVAISLGLLGDKNVVDDLIEELQQATSLTAQSSIASALGTIGDARSIEPLLEMLSDGELNVRGRAFAAVALGIVGDKEPLPWNAKIAVGANYTAGTTTLTDGQGAGILDIL